MYIQFAIGIFNCIMQFMFQCILSTSRCVLLLTIITKYFHGRTSYLHCRLKCYFCGRMHAVNDRLVYLCRDEIAEVSLEKPSKRDAGQPLESRYIYVYNS